MTTFVTFSWGTKEPASWSIAIHGGAGNVRSESIPKHVEGCRRAADEGAKILRAGGSALDAVQRAVEILESDPCFNAGTGACLTSAGTLELDASIMEGGTLRCGAVTVLPSFHHPIAIARAVLESNGHLLYAGEGAEHFAIANGFVRAPEDEMITALAREKWEIARGTSETSGWAGGTVGAVARDSNGHVAAATSTGGKVNKAPGRVGDSPIIGAGTYADDAGGACSNTGDGEAVMRVVLAKTASDAMRDGSTPEDAARAAIDLLLSRAGGMGGTILVDAQGRIGIARSTETMTWAAASSAFGPSGPELQSGS
ncbi:MAG: isoaspartyl peptidase/L-asparaginase [Polyangiaceae bacterium]